METSDAKKIVKACDDRNLNYSFITMMPTFVRKNQNTVVKIVGDNLYGFRKPLYSENNNVDGIEMLILPIEQVCEIHVTAHYNDMKSLMEELGGSFTEEELALLIHMDNYDSQIEPETGDYNRFRYITGRSYDLLTDEQKAAYEEEKAAYEADEAKKLGINQAASISMS